MSFVELLWKLGPEHLKMLDKLFNLSYNADFTPEQQELAHSMHKVIISLKEAGFL